MGNLASVEAFAKRWLAKDCALDILANNAGIGGLVRTKKTGDGFELTHQVNFLAHVDLTMNLLPSLIRARRPRIICTVSNMQYRGIFDLNNTMSFENAYPNNKLYFQTWLTELQHRMSSNVDYRHVTIQGVHPGFVNTNIWIVPENNQESMLQKVFRALLRAVGKLGTDAQQGSLAITHAATAPECGSELDESFDVKAGKGGGRFFNRVWEEEPMPQTRDMECRRQIWEYVGKQLRLEERGLLKDLDSKHNQGAFI